MNPLSPVAGALFRSPQPIKPRNPTIARLTTPMLTAFGEKLISVFRSFAYSHIRLLYHQDALLAGVSYRCFQETANRRHLGGFTEYTETGVPSAPLRKHCKTSRSQYPPVVEYIACGVPRSLLRKLTPEAVMARIEPLLP